MNPLQSQPRSASRHIVLLALAFFALSSAARAHAQRPDSDVSVYLTSTTANYAFFNNNGSSTVYKGVSSGIGGGLTANFTGHARTTLGIDIQGADTFTSTGGAFSIVSLRLGYVPRSSRLRPYVKVGGGLVSSTERIQDYPGPFTTVSPRPSTSLRVINGTIAAAAGLDVRLTPVLDLRLFEFGIAPDTSTTYDRVGAGFISSGLVLHLPRTHIPNHKH